jgi:hypothetical protein
MAANIPLNFGNLSVIYDEIHQKNMHSIRERTDLGKPNRLNETGRIDGVFKMRYVARAYFSDEPNLGRIGHPEWTIDDGERTVDTFKKFIREHPYVSKWILLDNYAGGPNPHLGGRSHKSKRSKRSKRSKKSRKSRK